MQIWIFSIQFLANRLFLQTDPLPPIWGVGVASMTLLCIFWFVIQFQAKQCFWKLAPIPFPPQGIGIWWTQCFFQIWIFTQLIAKEKFIHLPTPSLQIISVLNWMLHLILKETIFCKLTPHPHEERELANMIFLCRSEHFIQFLAFFCKLT